MRIKLKYPTVFGTINLFNGVISYGISHQAVAGEIVRATKRGDVYRAYMNPEGGSSLYAYVKECDADPVTGLAVEPEQNNKQFYAFNARRKSDQKLLGIVVVCAQTGYAALAYARVFLTSKGSDASIEARGNEWPATVAQELGFIWADSVDWR